MRVPVSKLEETANAHNQAVLKVTKDPDEAPSLAYPRGKLSRILLEDVFREEGLSQCHFGCRFCSTGFLRRYNHASHPAAVASGIFIAFEKKLRL